MRLKSGGHRPGTGCVCVVRLGHPCAGDERDGRALTCIASGSVRTVPAMRPTTWSYLTHGHGKAVLLRQAPPSPEYGVVHDGLLPPLPSVRTMSLFCETESSAKSSSVYVHRNLRQFLQ